MSPRCPHVQEVPQSCIGSIIGAQGSNINRIRSESGAKIKVFDEPAPNGERNIEIAGTAEQVRHPISPPSLCKASAGTFSAASPQLPLVSLNVHYRAYLCESGNFCWLACLAVQCCRDVQPPGTSSSLIVAAPWKCLPRMPGRDCRYRRACKTP